MRSISKEASAAARLTASLLPWVTAALFWACPAPAVGAEEPEIVGAAGRPNILLLISDDQAWSDFGFMGHGVIETPRLDALAAEGRTFPRGYVPTALCRPSLATIITGLYPHQHGITGNDPPKGVAREEMLQLIAATETTLDADIQILAKSLTKILGA